MGDINFDADFFDDVDPECLTDFLLEHFKINVSLKPVTENQIQRIKRLANLICKVKEAELIAQRERDKEVNP